MFTIMRLLVVFIMASVLSYIGFGLFTWPFWVIALCTILYGEIRARETVQDIAKLIRKGDFNTHK